MESEIQALISQSRGLAQDKEFSPGYDYAFVTTVDAESTKNNIRAEIANNHFRHPIDSNSGTTGTVIEEDGVLYVQKCLYNELYYEPCNIHGDTYESTTILAHSTDSWFLCESAPSFKDNPMVKDGNFDKWLLED